MSEDKFLMSVDVLTDDISTEEKDGIWSEIEKRVDEAHSTEKVSNHKSFFLHIRDGAYILAGIAASFLFITVALHPKTVFNVTMGSGHTRVTYFLTHSYVLSIVTWFILMLVAVWFLRRQRRSTLLSMITGSVIGQIAYYSALWIAWWLVGWQANNSFLGAVAALVACIVNPLTCGYVANQISYGSGKLFTVTVLVLYFALVLVCAPASNAIWIHASGYYNHFTTIGPTGVISETLIVNHLVNVIGMVISGIFFIGAYIIMKRVRKANKNPSGGGL